MRKTLLRTVVSIFFIGLLFYLMRKDIPNIAGTLSSANPVYLATGVALYAVSVLLLALRLRLIYGVQDTPISFRAAAEITFVGFFFNNFLPTAVGGDLVKAYCGGRITGERMKSFTSVLTDRLMGLFMFILIPSVTVFFLMDKLDPRIPVAIFAVLAGALAGAIFIFNRGIARRFGFLMGLFKRLNISDKVVMIYDGLHHFKNHKSTVALILGLSTCGQLLSIGSVYCFIRALSVGIDPFYVILLTPIVSLMSMLPSINGLGVREGAFVYFFKSLIGLPQASALAILYLFLLLLMSLVGGVVYLFRHEYHFRLREITEAPKINTGGTPA